MEKRKPGERGIPAGTARAADEMPGGPVLGGSHAEKFPILPQRGPSTSSAAITKRIGRSRLGATLLSLRCLHPGSNPFAASFLASNAREIPLLEDFAKKMPARNSAGWKNSGGPISLPFLRRAKNARSCVNRALPVDGFARPPQGMEIRKSAIDRKGNNALEVDRFRKSIPDGGNSATLSSRVSRFFSARSMDIPTVDRLARYIEPTVTCSMCQ
jgi:hypothetical protein